MTTGQCLLFFDFLCERCGERDLERDFLVDFLGVRERDFRDRFGVLGDEGDLGKEIKITGHSSRLLFSNSCFQLNPD